jgi:hypothetical protein
LDRPVSLLDLPAWADNVKALPLLAGIIVKPPEARLIRDDWGTPDTPWYRTSRRPDVAALKRMHTDWLDRELAALDAQFAMTGKWCADASRSVLGAETPDQLIHRLLTQHAERADLEPNELPDGRFQVAA